MIGAEAVEAALCRIIAGVLGEDRIGPEDGFFEAGGDSVLAVQVVARAREAGLDLSVRDLFDHQTPASLAAVIGALPAATPGPADATLTPDAPDTPLVAFADDEFGDFEAVDAAGSEAEWETIT
ncbi:phosphopantetheine-binding protein [Actinomadura sp. 9N215]|uniref:phosphopantetheine-binding protein n=1 Tax=Actinomadura sp. 9N215 TaxID=3375150 RepID=UPI00378E4AAE